eukprot:SAG22_NODE_2758_length_2239_cov_1.881776_3_plen_97_part_00
MVLEEDSYGYWRNVLHLGDCKLWLLPGSNLLVAAVSESDDPARWAVEGSSCEAGRALYLVRAACYPLQSVARHCTALHCTALHCTALSCCCAVLPQ